MLKFDVILNSFSTKLDELLGTVQGWLLFIACMVCNFLIDYRLAFIGVLVCIFIDMVVGIWSAIKQGKYAKSELMRDTFSKVFIYCGALIMIIFMEKLIGLDTIIGTNIAAAMICATELWSISGNALIINPNLHFFKIMKPALIGEIARKLHITEEEVKEVFDKEEQLIEDKKKGEEGKKEQEIVQPIKTKGKKKK